MYPELLSHIDIITINCQIPRAAFSYWSHYNKLSCTQSCFLILISLQQTVMYPDRASKTFVLFVLCTEAETGYFGGRQAVKGEESQYSLTEALCLFWVPPWGLHLSPVTNIHIIDRVSYCRMAFLSPIIENWLWKWYRGIEKNTFQANFFFFSGIFHSFCAFMLQHVWNVWKYLCGNHDYAKSKKEADFVLKKVRRPKILFWRSVINSELLSHIDIITINCQIPRAAFSYWYHYNKLSNTQSCFLILISLQ